MSIRLAPIPFADVLAEVAAHLEGLPGPIDSYHEEHLRDAVWHRIERDGERIGLGAIHNAGTITHFALEPVFRQHSQEAFAALRRTEKVTEALVSTADAPFLANALDNHRSITLQAYAFALAPDRARPEVTGFTMRPATPADREAIVADSGDFFGNYLHSLTEAEGVVQIYVVSRDGEPVAYGISERSGLYRGTASIGMFVREEVRNTGAGTATIGLLIEEMLRRGLSPVAGCWYYNHASKRTLERAGLHAATRLLRIGY
ncbi:MAG: GNAT family N-acetyltransferase [Chloroflexota bacterium]|nr:GNAT family N-acetyltransferase [Chloroflexota bacterium]